MFDDIFPGMDDSGRENKNITILEVRCFYKVEKFFMMLAKFIAEPSPIRSNFDKSMFSASSIVISIADNSFAIACATF